MRPKKKKGYSTCTAVLRYLGLVFAWLCDVLRYVGAFFVVVKLIIERKRKLITYYTVYLCYAVLFVVLFYSVL